MEELLRDFIFILLMLSFCFFILIRNFWVHNNLNHLIQYDFLKYKQTEGYYIILLKFWIWDFNKFIKKDKNGRN